MNRNLTTFSFNDRQLHALTDEHGNPWFLAKDACDILGIATNHLREGLDTDEITELTNLPNTEVGGIPTIPGTDTANGGRAPLIISESGLYSLILRSRKPEAKEFKRWVTHDVLPSIRRTGAYATGDATVRALTDPKAVAAILLEYDRTRTENQRLKTENEHASRQIEAQKPKVLFANAVETSHTSILVGDLAKILKGNGVSIGANRLFQWLRDNGYLIRRKGTDWNMPTQRSMELGLFEVKETAITHSDGHVSVNRTPKITGKGQTYLVNRFLSRLNTLEVTA